VDFGGVASHRLAKMEDTKKIADKKVQEQGQEQDHDVEHQDAYGETSSLGKDDILQLEHTDPVLIAKMHLVNNAIDEVSLAFEDILVVFTDWGFLDWLYEISMEGIYCVSESTWTSLIYLSSSC
jgi:hypothetical protein